MEMKNTELVNPDCSHPVNNGDNKSHNVECLSSKIPRSGGGKMVTQSSEISTEIEQREDEEAASFRNNQGTTNGEE